MVVEKIKILIATIFLVLLLSTLGYLFYLDAYQNSSQDQIGFCGISTNGFCLHNSDCIVSGCSGQVCQSKEEGSMITTCEYKPCYNSKTYNMVCKCIKGKCQWSKA